MLRFANPEYLYFLLIIPVMVFLHIFMNMVQKRKLKKYGDINLLKELMPDFSAIRFHSKVGILMIAFALVCFMMARPQAGTTVDNSEREGIETIICMDISNSMLAEDIQPSRLDKAKMLVSRLVDSFKDDKVGLIVFAGEAYTQLPITADFVSAKMFLEQINPSLIQVQGTDIQAAIDLASHSFTQQEKVGKAIIVITDGENHEGGANDAAKAAAAAGMRVYVMGVGSEDGSPFKLPGESDYKKDDEGNIVVTKLNSNMCKEIAQAGQGAYIHVDNSNSAQESLENELSKLAKAQLNITSYSEYDEQFWVFGLLALLFLLIEVVIMEKKNPLFKNIKLFKR